jgi:LAO/AO transport system kinase
VLSLAQSALRAHPGVDALAMDVAEGRIDVYAATKALLDDAGLVAKPR